MRDCICRIFQRKMIGSEDSYDWLYEILSEVRNRFIEPYEWFRLVFNEIDNVRALDTMFQASSVNFERITSLIRQLLPTDSRRPTRSLSIQTMFLRRLK